MLFTLILVDIYVDDYIYVCAGTYLYIYYKYAYIIILNEKNKFIKYLCICVKRCVTKKMKRYTEH